MSYGWRQGSRGARSTAFGDPFGFALTLTEKPLLRLVFRSSGADPAAAAVEQHDELAPLVAAVLNGDVAALRTFVTAIVPDLIRVVRRVLGANHPDVEDTATKQRTPWSTASEGSGANRRFGTSRARSCVSEPRVTRFLRG